MVRDWSFAGDIVNAIDMLLEKRCTKNMSLEQA